MIRYNINNKGGRKVAPTNPINEKNPSFEMRVKYENSGTICNQQYNFADKEGTIKIGEFEITEEGGNSFLSFPINNNDARLEEVAKLIALDSEKQGDIVKIPLEKVTITTSGNVAFKLSSAKGRGSLATNFTITPNSVKTSSQEIVVVPSGKVMDVTLPKNFFQLFLGKSNDRFKVEGALPVEFFDTLRENKKFFDPEDKVISVGEIENAAAPIPIVKIGDDSYLAVNSKMRKVESVSRENPKDNGACDIYFTFKAKGENVARRVQDVTEREQNATIKGFMGISEWWENEKYIDKKLSVATKKLTENKLQKKTESKIKQIAEEELEQNFNAEVTPDGKIDRDNDNKDLEDGEINGSPSGGNPPPPDVTGNNKKPAESEHANDKPAPEDEIDEPAKNITGEDQNQNPKDEEEKPVSDKPYVYPSRGKYLAMGILLGAFALIALFTGLAGLLSMCVAFGSLAVGMGTVMAAEVTADAGAGRMEVSLAGEGKPSRIKSKDREARKEKRKEKRNERKAKRNKKQKKSKEKDDDNTPPDIPPGAGSNVISSINNETTEHADDEQTEEILAETLTDENQTEDTTELDEQEQETTETSNEVTNETSEELQVEDAASAEQSDSEEVEQETNETVVNALTEAAASTAQSQEAQKDDTLGYANSINKELGKQRDEAISNGDWNPSNNSINHGDGGRE